MAKDNKKEKEITIYIASGASGSSALHIVETVLAQFRFHDHSYPAPSTDVRVVSARHWHCVH